MSSDDARYDDNVRLRQVLKSQEDRLFLSRDSDLTIVEVVQLSKTKATAPQGFISSFAKSAQELQNLISVLDFENSDVLFILRQSCTWGRFMLTPQAFDEILNKIQFSYAFFDILQTYGFKLRDDEPRFGCWNIQYQPQLIDQDEPGFGRQTSKTSPKTRFDSEYILEFTYTLRYVEENGRRQGNPWSMRQCGVYQKRDPATKNSIWILLQPPRCLYDNIRSASTNDHNYNDTRALPLHDAIFWAMEANWRRYIKSLDTTLHEMQDKAFHSRVGPKVNDHFSVAFADYQDIQKFLTRIRTNLSALKNNFGVIKGYQDFINHSTIQNYFRNHLQAMEGLLADGEGTSQVLAHILSHRNNQALIQTSEHVRQLVESAKVEGQNIQNSLRSSQDDSKTIKMLSIIAVLYLPASLVASVFSTGLIQYGESDDRGSVHLSTSFWLLPVLTLALSFITFSITQIVLRLWH
ncbi:hypothetical protein FPOA_10864 [Fusarium poae]|uniref:CorA-like transporter domain-containing protein n=1 Tax=Fusarium poae TaxID=36050 RepID=A0A1B8AF96_FUSPO|nr:hypothetical protein FPOA_10864 [Fusarium poae]